MTSEQAAIYLWMNTVTHALLPVIGTALACRGEARLDRRGLVFIGLAGAMPDVLNPHLSLEARMTSWSHGLPFWLLFSLVGFVASLSMRDRFPLRVAVLCSCAYILHMLCDAISGGVNFLHPFGDWTWGKFWVHPVWWVPLDTACLLTCYFLFRALPRLRALRQRTSAG